MDTLVEGGPILGPVLEPGVVAPPGRRRFVHLRRLLVASLVLALLALGDWGLRVREMHQLVDAVDDSERSMTSIDTAIREVLLRWQTQSTTTPTLTTAAVLADGSRNTLDSLHKYTSVGESSMVAHGADVHRVLVVPWHRSLRQAQEDYLAHLQAWHDYYAALAVDFSVYAEPQPAISGTFETAGSSLRRAVPDPDPFGFGDRVERVLAAD